MSYPFSAYLGVAGLVDVGYRFYGAADTALAARQTSGIVNAGDGWYSVQATPPTGFVSVRWDSTGTPAAKAREYFYGAASQAVVDALDGLVTTGNGAFAVTVTVNNGTSVLENARVRFTEGANTYTGLTNASGVIAFSLDAATYTISITKSNHSFTPVTQVISGNVSITKSMTVTVPLPSPSSPELCVVFGTLIEPDGTPLADTDVTFRLVTSRNAASTGQVVQTTDFTVATDGDGYIETELLRTDELKRPNTYYEVTCTAVGWQKKRLVLAAGSYDLSAL